MKDLKYNKFKMQKYLKPETRFTNAEINFALNLRANMLNVRGNFRTTQQIGEQNCRLCNENNIEDQQHLLRCSRLNSNNLSAGGFPNYEDIFSEDPEKILDMTRKIKHLYRQFQELLNSPSEPVVINNPLNVNSVSAALSDRTDPE